MLRIVESWSSATRLGMAAEFLARQAPSREVLVIGASRLATDDFIHKNCVSHRSTFGLHGMSFSQLALRLALQEMASSGQAPSTTTGEEAIAWRAIHEAAKKSKLTHYLPLVGSPGFARCLARTVRECRQSVIHSKDAARSGSVGSEFAELLPEFVDELERSAISDRADLFRLAVASIERRSWPWSSDTPLLILDVPIHTNVERGFASRICAKTEICLATVPTGDELTLIALKSVVGAEHELLKTATENTLHRLQQSVFADEVLAKPQH